MSSDSDSARLKNASEAVRLCREAEDPLALAEALKALGYLERQLKLTEAAREHYEEAAAIYRENAEHLALAHTVRHVGDIFHDMKRSDLAEPYYEEALAIYRNERNPPVLDLANAIRSLAVLKSDTGNPGSAKLLWQEARHLYASVEVHAGVAECDRRLSTLA